MQADVSGGKGTQHEAIRTLWRLALRMRFLLFQRHRYDSVVLEEIADRRILVLRQVFNPRLFRTGEFLACALDAHLIPWDSTVLDMGTGSGVGAIFASRWARRVVAVDVNPAAVRCARINAMINEVEDRVEVRLGDLFAPVMGERFDVILFNPPYFRGVPSSPLDHALHATDVAERFAAGLPDHLEPNGSALVLLSSHGDEAGFLRALEGVGMAAEVVADRDLISEVLSLYRVTRPDFEEVNEWKSSNVDLVQST